MGLLSNLAPYESILLLKRQGRLYSYWHQRRPLLDTGYQGIGVLLTAKALGHVDWIPSRGKRIKADSFPELSSYTLVHEDGELNPDELLVLFFLLRLGSAAAIAQYTRFSLPKIHTHMRGLYRKFDCQDKKTLIKTAIDAGYWFRIPKPFFARHWPLSQAGLPWPEDVRVVLSSAG